MNSNKNSKGGEGNLNEPKLDSLFFTCNFLEKQIVQFFLKIKNILNILKNEHTTHQLALAQLLLCAVKVEVNIEALQELGDGVTVCVRLLRV